MKRDSDGFSVM